MQALMFIGLEELTVMISYIASYTCHNFQGVAFHSHSVLTAQLQPRKMKTKK